MHAAGNLSRTSSDNFMSFFLTLCEEYDVSPLPKLLPIGSSFVERLSVTSIRRTDPREVLEKKPETLSQHQTENSAPVIYVSYERPKELNNAEKIECKGYEISVCILDALSISIENFFTITTIRLPNCRINAFGISQIAQILKKIGCVRDLNLDMNPNIRENYHLLCSPSGKLQYLSLKYCNISDVGVEKIANELKYKEHQLPQLIGLNLANNCLTDFGAEHIAKMLHTNRSLQSLVLTGNRISDPGAALMIQELCMYSLTHDEIVELRRLNYKRLLHHDVKPQNSIPIDSRISGSTSRNSSSKQKRKTSKTRKRTNSKLSANTKRETLLSEMDSTINNDHPLCTEIRPIKGQLMAIGNFELQHLNLSYNHLTNESLKKMVHCVCYQNYTMLGDISKGLLYINFEVKAKFDYCVKKLRDTLKNVVLTIRATIFVSKKTKAGITYMNCYELVYPLKMITTWEKMTGTSCQLKVRFLEEKFE